jgi:nicotinamidase-related amidase
MTALDSSRTALLIVDLMPRILDQPLQPRSGSEVARACMALATRFRVARSTVVLIRVERPNVSEQPPGSGFVDGLQHDGDIIIVKHTVGAFHETDLDEQLRGASVERLVLAGVATNMGVESTARAASDRNYELVFVEDAMAALTAAEHQAALTSFARFGDVVTSKSFAFD